MTRTPGAGPNRAMTQTATTPSRRRYFRVPARLDARVLLRGESPIEASLSDLSASGLSMVVRGADVDQIVAIRRWLAEGVVVHVEVELAGRPIVLAGRIAWTRPVDGSREMMAGVRFEGIDSSTERVLRGWLVRGLAAIQGAARHVLLERWEDAAECLAAVGIDDALPPTVSAVLRYAATHGRVATA